MIFPIIGRTEMVAATQLMTDFGDNAAAQADARARASRDRGNAILFAQWRRVGHVIALLRDETARGTLH